MTNRPVRQSVKRRRLSSQGRLTLRIDDRLVNVGRRHAKRAGLSLPKFVEQFLRTLPDR